MKLKNKKVLVYGLGESGRAAIKLLKEQKAEVSFYDDNINFFNYIGFEREPRRKHFDIAIVSPGIKCQGNALLQHLQEEGTLVLSELDFGYLMSRGKVIGVTGTNGKTTTCMLVYKILKNAGYKVFLCGNIGVPISAIASQTTKKSVIVCEVSNFQLELCNFFRPNIGCVLNIKPDHIDRHGSFEEYKRVKAKIAENMARNDVLILNLDDEESKTIAKFRHTEFFSKDQLKCGTYVFEESVYKNKKALLSLEDIKLRGNKNLENVLASVAICSHFKVKKEIYSKTLQNFVPASHRMEVIGKINGVTYVDDSKATNVASTIACLEAFSKERVILLAGGRGKDISYDELFSCGGFLKEIVCFGEEGENIFQSAKKHGKNSMVFTTMSKATKHAIELAADGDYVVLSPACSSFDEFENYAERGERFKEIVLGEFK